MPDPGQSPADAVPDQPAPDRAAWPDLDTDKAKQAADQPEWPDDEQSKPAAAYAWPGQDEPADAERWPAQTAAKDDPAPVAESVEPGDKVAEPEADSVEPERKPEVKSVASILAPEPEPTPEPDDEPAVAAEHEPADEPEPEPVDEPEAEPEPVAQADDEPEPEPEEPQPEPKPEPAAEATPEPVEEVEEPDEPTATFPVEEPTAAVPVDIAEPEQRTDAFPIKELGESTGSFPVRQPEQRTESEPERATGPSEPEQRTDSFPIERPGQRIDLFSPERTDSYPIEEPAPRAEQSQVEQAERRTESVPADEPPSDLFSPQQPEQRTDSFPVEQPGQRTAVFPVEQPEQRTETFPVEQPGQRTETFRPTQPEQRTAVFPVEQPGQRTQAFPVKPPAPTTRIGPVADNTTTQFLPRIDPIAPPPPRPVQRIESTQVIPVYRAAPPTPAETTQHIPLPVESTQHIPPTRYPDRDRYDDVGYDDTGEQAAVTDDEPPRRRNKKKRRAILVSAGAVIVVIAVGAAVVLTQPKLAAKLGLRAIAAGPTTQPPPSPVVYSAQLKPAGGAAPTPSTSGVTQALAASVANPAVGGLAGTVLDAATGQVLWDHGSTTQVAPASTNKLLTCAAALLTFTPQTTLDTQAVAGAQPGTVILVGGGDPTLNSLAAPQQSVYPGSARISDLAAQVKAHNPGQISHILVDVSKFTGPTSAPGWDPPSPSQNNWAPIQPVMLDGGRLIPTKTDTPRTYSPALVAGQALATQLGVSPSIVSLTTTPTPAGATQLGLVHSVTVPDLVANMLQISDNVLAEVMGRMVAIADHQEPSFTGATAAVLDTLRRNGFDTTGVSLSDDSGLSPSDRLTPRLLAQILRVAASADTSDPRVARLRPLLLGLPIAGSPVGDGTLAGRYQTAPSSAGKGWVRAKTGTLGAQGVYALAGVVLDADGRLLVFALVSNAAPSALAPTVLDTMAATLRGCGCR